MPRPGGTSTALTLYQYDDIKVSGTITQYLVNL